MLRCAPVTRALASLPWIALLLFPVVELTAHAGARAAVVPPADFRAAARFVRARLGPRDLIASAPSWTDPLLRNAIGDRIDLAMAGRSDSAAYERLWSFSIR